MSTKLGDGIGPARMEWSGAVQKRVADTSTMLSQIKSLKMMGLTDYMGRCFGKLHVLELDMSKKFRRIIVLLIMTANISDQFTPVVVITAAVYWARNGPDGLTIRQAFTALSLSVTIARCTYS